MSALAIFVRWSPLVRAYIFTRYAHYRSATVAHPAEIAPAATCRAILTTPAPHHAAHFGLGGGDVRADGLVVDITWPGGETATFTPDRIDSTLRVPFPGPGSDPARGTDGSGDDGTPSSTTSANVDGGDALSSAPDAAAEVSSSARQAGQGPATAAAIAVLAAAGATTVFGIRAARRVAMADASRRV